MINEEKRRRAEYMVLRLSTLLMNKLNDPNSPSNNWNRNREDIIEQLASYLSSPSAPIIDSSEGLINALNYALENQTDTKKSSLLANMNISNRSLSNTTTTTTAANIDFNNLFQKKS